MSPVGTNLTNWAAALMSVNRGRPEVAGHRQNGANDPTRTIFTLSFEREVVVLLICIKAFMRQED
jgi:hypothetical protein